MKDKEYYLSQTGDNRFYVYIHRKATDGSPFYVGKGQGKRAWYFYNRSDYWKRIADKHGVVVDIVFDDLDEDAAFQCEKDIILELNYFGHTLCNLTEGGDGASGMVMSEEARKQISESLRNSPAVKALADSRRGVKRSPEDCKKIGDGRRGKLVGEEGRKNMSEAQKNSPRNKELVARLKASNTGRLVSEDEKRKTSEALKGKSKSAEHARNISEGKRDKNVYRFINLETYEEVQGTRREFASFLFVPLWRVASVFRAYLKGKASNNWKLLGKVEEL